MAGLKIITDTDVLPVSQALAKLYMRIDVDDTAQDAVVDMILGAACTTAELRTARSFITRSYREFYDAFPGGNLPQRAALLGGNSGYYGLGPVDGMFGVFHRHRHERFELSRSPLATLTQIQYKDAAGVTQTVDPVTYLLNDTEEPARIVLAPDKCWPVPQCAENAVWIDYDAGYGDDDTTVPQMAKNVICQLINHFNENRDAVQGGQMAQLPYTLDNLLNLIRVYYQA